MSGTGHNTDCNKNALFDNARRAVLKSRALRVATHDACAIKTAARRPSVVLPTFHVEPRTASRPASHLIAIAFSAGGLQPLIHLLHALPDQLPAAIAIAHHVGDVSCLPALLRNQTQLKVKFAESGETLTASTVHICPPQRHLIINPDATVSLSSSGRIAHVRPSADWFLRTVAGSFDARALAVILSGASTDGAEGIARIFEAGGQTFVQDPRTCAFPSMPQAAIDARRTCRVLAPEELGPALTASLENRDLATAQAEWEEPFGPLAA